MVRFARRKFDKIAHKEKRHQLSKKPDRQVRCYEPNGVHVTIKPRADGIATIWDKNVLIHAISQLLKH